MARFSRFTPDAKMIVAVLAASYVAAVVFTFVPALAPASIAGRLGAGK
jgi:hypothetical protein